MHRLTTNSRPGGVYPSSFLLQTIGLVTVAILISGINAQAEEPVVDRPDDILVIANNAVDITNIEVDELRAIFLKRKASWGDGKKVIPINAPDGSKMREEFRRLVIGMNRNREQSYWQTQMIKHGVSRPPEFGNSLKAVFKLRGSVSYIYRADFKKGVAKVVLTLRPSQ